MASSYGALTIAKWFVAWAEEDDADRSNLKIQKLLYYAQGYFLKLFGRPLFNDAMEAWSHGPVVPVVYREFKNFGSGDVSLAEDDPFDFEDVDKETTKFLMRVWKTYGGYGAWNLRNMTHEERPWQVAFKQKAGRHEISLDLMKERFKPRSDS